MTLSDARSEAWDGIGAAPAACLPTRCPLCSPAWVPARGHLWAIMPQVTDEQALFR